MNRAGAELPRPYVPRYFELIRAGPDGTYWQGEDGMMVRVAAAEPRGRRVGESEASDTPLPAHDAVSTRAGGR